MKHVGIDIAKATFTAAFHGNENAKWSDGEFTNDEKGFKKLLLWAGEDAEFTMEATGLYHVNCAMYLHERKHKVHVCNPLQVKRFGQMQIRRTKTDKADARMIVEFAEMNAGMLVAWKPAPENLAKARSMLSVMRLLQKHCTAKTNALEALRLTLFGRKAAVPLAKALQSDRKQIKSLEKQLVKLVCETHQEAYELAQTIPGVGPKTAAGVILCAGELKQFDNSRQLSAYFGMSPRQFQSGTSVNGKGHICKMGNPYVRYLLYLCAVSSLRCNKACKAYYDALVARGKPKKVALIAVANKILRTMFAVMKNGVEWKLEAALAH